MAEVDPFVATLRESSWSAASCAAVTFAAGQMTFASVWLTW
jgi:hypothetical protein